MNIKQNYRLTRSLERTREVANYRHVHGRYPSQKAAAKKVSQLGVWLSNRRGILNGTGGSGTWYPECEVLAKGLGCPDMFNFVYAEQGIPVALDRIGQLAEYKRKHGRYPPANHTKHKKYSNKALKMGRWLMGMRAARLNKPTDYNEYVWFPEYELMARNYGCEDMFKKQPRCSKYALGRTRDVAEYKKIYGKYPTSRSENGLLLGAWLCSVRRAKVGETSERTWFPECGQLAITLGCADMFNRKKILQGGEARTKAVIEYHRTHGKYPSSCDSDEHYRQLAGWLKRLRGAKRGLEPTTKWRPECENLAVEMGYPDLFEYQTK